MSCRSLMVQGTTSDAGKTTLVAALCRILKRRGVKVAPFKPQNMALNSAVTVDGGEIGRAQALQALAAGLAPHSDFNPVLLKPTTDKTAQIIIHGRVAMDLDARDYHAYKPRAMGAVLASWGRLTATYELINPSPVVIFTSPFKCARAALPSYIIVWLIAIAPAEVPAIKNFSF